MILRFHLTMLAGTTVEQYQLLNRKLYGPAVTGTPGMENDTSQERRSDVGMVAVTRPAVSGPPETQVITGDPIEKFGP